MHRSASGLDVELVQEISQGAANPASFGTLRKSFTGIPLLGCRRIVDLDVGAAELLLN